VNPVARVGLLTAYAVLGIAATGRSTIQLATKAAEAPVAYTLSAVAAILYIVIALALWRGWERVAFVFAAVELAGVVTVSVYEFVASNPWPDATVWTSFGIGYGFTPLILPLLALWLLRRTPRDASVSQEGLDAT